MSGCLLYDPGKPFSGPSSKLIVLQNKTMRKRKTFLYMSQFAYRSACSPCDNVSFLIRKHIYYYERCDTLGYYLNETREFKVQPFLKLVLADPGLIAQTLLLEP